MRTISGWLVGLCSAGALAAGAGDDKQVSLTIYNSDLALVEHLRPLDVPAGVQRIEFSGVSAQILPQTVSFTADGLELIEQNFDYDLLTPANLMDKAVGAKVRLVRTNPATGAETAELAEVLSTTGGAVMRIGNRIEILREDNLPARVIFDKVPENLRPRPTLSVLVNAAQPVTGDAHLAYLTRGLSWNADYVALFDEGRGLLSMQGWITLTNLSGTSFANARAQLVAGDINFTLPGAQNARVPYAQRTQGGAGTEANARQRIADYYLYPLTRPTTIANNQNKQVSFLESTDARASKGYEISFNDFKSSDEPASAQVRVRFANSKAGGLGEPLPAGMVRVYTRDSQGQPKFIGEDRIGHTASGSEIALRIGDAFDVTVQPTLRQTNAISKRLTDYSMSYLVRNARATPVVLTLRQKGLWRINEVREESLEGRRTDADSFAWDVSVPAHGETTLNFTLRQGW